MGERSVRRLLIIGANSVIIKRRVHCAARHMAGRDADAQAADAGAAGAGEQNGVHRMGPDRTAVFSDAAIQFCLTIKDLFKLPLRQTKGMGGQPAEDG